MENYYFLFFLLNLGLWGGAGLLVSYFFLQKRKRKNELNLVALIIFSAVVGGTLAFLVNGMPNIASSVNNLTAAMMFAVFPAVLFFPKSKRQRKKVYPERSRRTISL